MAIFLGFFIVVLVLFMIFAMAVAEWADKDPGELFAAWFGKRKPGVPPAAGATAPVQPVQSATASAVKTKASAKTRKRSPKR